MAMENLEACNPLRFSPERAPRELANLTSEQERALFTQARGGDPEKAASAREYLCALSYPTIEKTLKRYSGTLDYAARDDLIQESCIAVFDFLIDRHDEERGRFTSFVEVVTKNRAMSFMRTTQRNKVSSLDATIEVEDGTVTLADTLADPYQMDAEVVYNQTPRPDITPLLADLSNQQRHCLSLRYLSRRHVTVIEQGKALGIEKDGEVEKAKVKSLANRAHSVLNETEALPSFLQRYDFDRPDGSTLVPIRKIEEVLNGPEAVSPLEKLARQLGIEINSPEQIQSLLDTPTQCERDCIEAYYLTDEPKSWHAVGRRQKLHHKKAKHLASRGIYKMRAVLEKNGGDLASIEEASEDAAAQRRAA